MAFKTSLETLSLTEYMSLRDPIEFLAPGFGLVQTNRGCWGHLRSQQADSEPLSEKEREKERAKERKSERKERKKEIKRKRKKEGKRKRKKEKERKKRREGKRKRKPICWFGDIN